jgi:prepilin-type N-terminal cleavage/methylation domain-containing protein/prepilin-type processing-associated H-X9-DG protein
MRRGFTLIELLVVIAIIAILAAILFPVFARAKAKANQNNCLSNVKELQLAVIMYSSDWSQVYPLAYNCCGGLTWYWQGTLYPYIKNMQIYICPSDPTVGGSINVCCPTNTNNNGVNQFSYGFNSYLGIGGSPTNPGADIAESEPALQYPAEMMGISDAVAWYIPTAIGGTGFGDNSTTFAGALGAMCTGGSGTNCRHNLGCNMGFMDGHAHWMPLSSIPDPTQPAGTVTNGITNCHFWYGTDTFP